MYAVLTELFDLPHGLKEAWVHALVERLAGHQPPLGIRYACPCCDFLTLEKPPVGTFVLCSVCWWEDDNVQFDDLDYRGGANTLSLREARENFKRCGASSPRFREHMRQPLPEETP